MGGAQSQGLKRALAAAPCQPNKKPCLKSSTTACDKTKCSALDSEFFEEDDIVTRGIPSNLNGAARVRKNVAIFADYDGCFDIISESNPDGSKMDEMFDYAKEIGRLIYPKSHAQQMLTDFLDEVTDGASKVFLFSGSNRQSREADESNAMQNGNGLSMIGLKKLAEDRTWHFESRLLEDVGVNPKSILSSLRGSSEIKKRMVENNFKLLTEQTEVYFFDDIAKYLKYTQEKVNVPDNIEFKTVHFDWYGICIDGTQAGDRPLVPICTH